MLPKKIVHKARDFLGNKIADVATKSKDDNIEEKDAILDAIL